MEHGKAGVLRCSELLNNGFNVIVKVNADDLVFGNHDVIDRNPIEIEHAEHHILGLRRDLRPFKDHRSQFVSAQMILVVSLI